MKTKHLLTTVLTLTILFTTGCSLNKQKTNEPEQKQQNKQKEQTTTTTQTQAEENSPAYTTPEEISFEDLMDTSTWKTYTNEEYGISFRYPEQLEIEESTSVESDFTTGTIHMIILHEKNKRNETLFVVYLTTPDYERYASEGSLGYYTGDFMDFNDILKKGYFKFATEGVYKKIGDNKVLFFRDMAYVEPVWLNFFVFAQNKEKKLPFLTSSIILKEFESYEKENEIQKTADECMSVCSEKEVQNKIDFFETFAKTIKF